MQINFTNDSVAHTIDCLEFAIAQLTDKYEDFDPRSAPALQLKVTILEMQMLSTGLSLAARQEKLI
jgi:hypothetical protein